MNGQPISPQLQLKDFAKAYDGPPTDPKVFEEQQKKLQDELQKRAEEARKRLKSQQRRPAAPGSTARAKHVAAHRQCKRPARDAGLFCCERQV